MSELKVGLLTLLALGSVVFMSVKITSNQPGFGNYVTYKTILDDASGILEKSNIKVAGINAGKIKKIELAGSKALLTFQIKEGIKITKNARLQVKSVGFLGDKYIDVDLGESDPVRLTEDAYVPSEIAGGFDQIGKNAGDMIKEIKEVAILIKESLKEKDGSNRLEKITANIREITEDVKNIVKRNDGKIDEVIENVRLMTAQLQYETDRLQKGSLMSDFKKVGPILDNVDKAVIDLKEIIADVKDGKGTVGKLLRDDAVVDQVSQTLSSVNRLVNRINNIEADIGMSSGVNTRLGGDTRFDMDIYPAPERFFRIGLVTNEYGPVLEQESETCSSVNGGTENCTETRKINRSNFKFNVQIGRRLQRFGVRAGLIESTGGVGLDYFFPDWGIRTGVEVFDYQKEAGPNLRTIAEIKIWNVFYGRFAGEDLISKDGNQSATISLGLRFNDQDLAALVGLIAR